MRLFVCKKCGVETLESHDGMCILCYQAEKKNEDISKELLEDNGIRKFRWIAKIASMGKRRIIEVPKNQRTLINDKRDYIITIEEQ